MLLCSLVILTPCRHPLAGLQDGLPWCIQLSDTFAVVFPFQPVIFVNCVEQISPTSLKPLANDREISVHHLGVACIHSHGMHARTSQQTITSPLLPSPVQKQNQTRRSPDTTSLCEFTWNVFFTSHLQPYFLLCGGFWFWKKRNFQNVRQKNLLQFPNYAFSGLLLNFFCVALQWISVITLFCDFVNKSCNKDQWGINEFYISSGKLRYSFWMNFKVARHRQTAANYQTWKSCWQNSMIFFRCNRKRDKTATPWFCFHVISCRACLWIPLDSCSNVSCWTTVIQTKLCDLEPVVSWMISMLVSFHSFLPFGCMHSCQGSDIYRSFPLFVWNLYIDFSAVPCQKRQMFSSYVNVVTTHVEHVMILMLCPVNFRFLIAQDICCPFVPPIFCGTGKVCLHIFFCDGSFLTNNTGTVASPALAMQSVQEWKGTKQT